jgi:hypothetical protein
MSVPASRPRLSPAVESQLEGGGEVGNVSLGSLTAMLKSQTNAPREKNERQRESDWHEEWRRQAVWDRQRGSADRAKEGAERTDDARPSERVTVATRTVVKPQPARTARRKTGLACSRTSSAIIGRTGRESGNVTEPFSVDSATSAGTASVSSTSTSPQTMLARVRMTRTRVTSPVDRTTASSCLDGGSSACGEVVWRSRIK